jgi:hypothetical protein
MTRGNKENEGASDQVRLLHGQERTDDVNVSLLFSHFKDLRQKNVSTSPIKMDIASRSKRSPRCVEIAGGFAIAGGRGDEDRQTHSKKRR